MDSRDTWGLTFAVVVFLLLGPPRQWRL